MVVQVKCAGASTEHLNPKYIKVCCLLWRSRNLINLNKPSLHIYVAFFKVRPDKGGQYLEIRVRMPDSKTWDIPGFVEQGSSFKLGTGYYTAVLKDPYRFTNYSTKEWYSHMKVRFPSSHYCPILI